MTATAGALAGTVVVDALDEPAVPVDGLAHAALRAGGGRALRSASTVARGSGAAEGATVVVVEGALEVVVLFLVWVATAFLCPLLKTPPLTRARTRAMTTATPTTAPRLRLRRRCWARRSSAILAWRAALWRARLSVGTGAQRSRPLPPGRCGPGGTERGGVRMHRC